MMGCRLRRPPRMHRPRSFPARNQKLAASNALLAVTMSLPLSSSLSMIVRSGSGHDLQYGISISGRSIVDKSVVSSPAPRISAAVLLHRSRRSASSTLRPGRERSFLLDEQPRHACDPTVPNPTIGYFRGRLRRFQNARYDNVGQGSNLPSRLAICLRHCFLAAMLRRGGPECVNLSIARTSRGKLRKLQKRHTSRFLLPASQIDFIVASNLVRIPFMSIEPGHSIFKQILPRSSPSGYETPVQELVRDYGLIYRRDADRGMGT